MSLINEALKRAEHDKRRSGADGTESLPEPVHGERPKHPGGLKWIVLAGAVAAAGAGVWHVLPDGTVNAPSRLAAKADQNNRAAEPGQATPADEKKPVQVSPEAELAFARTLDALAYCPEPAPPAPEAAPPAAVEPARPPADMPPAKRPEKRIDPARFKLSGIMQTFDGGTAIINGAFIRVGQSIDGATVIRIDQHMVELEADGQRFRIRM